VLCYVVYAVLLAAGVHYTVANLAAVAAGMVFSFKTQGTFVFDNTDNRRIGRFLLSRLVIYIANVLFIKRMLMFGLDEYVSGAIAMPAIAMLSYALQRFFVFHNGKRPNSSRLTSQPWTQRATKTPLRAQGRQRR
jgi:putative flippase GtrA